MTLNMLDILVINKSNRQRYSIKIELLKFRKIHKKTPMSNSNSKKQPPEMFYKNGVLKNFTNVSLFPEILSLMWFGNS